MMKTNPFVVFVASEPSAHLAETAIIVLPNPNTNGTLIVADSPALIESMLPVVFFPEKINEPSSTILQLTIVALPPPMFLITAVIPIPPFIESIVRFGPMEIIWGSDQTPFLPLMSLAWTLTTYTPLASHLCVAVTGAPECA
jgi:hypothetical protein